MREISWHKAQLESQLYLFAFYWIILRSSGKHWRSLFPTRCRIQILTLINCLV